MVSSQKVVRNEHFGVGKIDTWPTLVANEGMAQYGTAVRTEGPEYTAERS